jgi:thioredoxin reductase/NAD-dependent dihydropyrimidine dehydrogenase PreA subunit
MIGRGGGTTGSTSGSPSDVRRGRQLAAAALAAALAVVAMVLVVPAGQLGSPGPLARPHARAGVTCAACHGARADGPATGQGCIDCHGAHASTRPAHRALASAGALGCPSCHVGHGADEGAEGITFVAVGEGDAEDSTPTPTPTSSLAYAIHWRGDGETRVGVAGPAGATVALVPLGVCARCHDRSRGGDPVQACVGSGGAAGIDVCFDEHQRAAEPMGSRGACARQHGPARYVAWEAARKVLTEGKAPTATRASAPWLWVGSGVGAGGLVFGLMASRRGRPRSSVRVSRALPLVPVRVRLPVIDAARCLGCHACVDACPFDVLSVDRHVAVVARPDECCGVATCEQACPNGSLRLADEGAPLTHRPRVDAHLESLDRRGIFLAGDLTGVPLIRNAIAQGTRVVERVAAQVRDDRRRTRPHPEERDPAPGSRTRAHASPDGASECVDLAVVGAGPAGLAAALRAKELGLRCVVLEQSTVAATLRAFPRGKIVHDPPIDLPLEGGLWLRESTKEELVAQWTRIVRAHRLEVREQHKVTGVTGDVGDHVVTSETPEGPRSLRAGRVLLAIGRRGTPRPLDAAIAPAAATRVVHALSDARALAGRRVLVVGLGDAAMEAVVALARQPGTTITVSYRGAGFTRGRARNIEEVRRLAANGRVRLVFASSVERVDDGWAVLCDSGQGPEKLAVDVVLALLGGEPARGLLLRAGIRMEGDEAEG